MGHKALRSNSTTGGLPLSPHCPDQPPPTCPMPVYSLCVLGQPRPSSILLLPMRHGLWLSWLISLSCRSNPFVALCLPLNLESSQSSKFKPMLLLAQRVLTTTPAGPSPAGLSSVKALCHMDTLHSPAPSLSLLLMHSSRILASPPLHQDTLMLTLRNSFLLT